MSVFSIIMKENLKSKGARIMKKEIITFEGTEMEFSYDQELLGKEMTVFNGAGNAVASIDFKEHVFTLESNGERGEYWLECVMYEPNSEHGTSESSFSDPFHEIPRTKEEALVIIQDWYQDELKQLIANQ